MNQYKQRWKQSPTMNTLIMVEDYLKSMDESVITIAKLRQNLPKQINNNMLKVILEYLEENNKIAFGLKGIVWISNTNPKMLDALRKGFEYE